MFIIKNPRFNLGQLFFHHLHPQIAPLLFLVSTGRLIIFRVRIGKFKIFENFKNGQTFAKQNVMPDNMYITKNKKFTSACTTKIVLQGISSDFVEICKSFF